jgi:MarR family transcriptional regulator, organic hydroperoxide resistance regulator
MAVTSAKVVARQKKFDSLEQEAYLQLWRTYDRLKELEDRAFERYELSAQQYNALRILRSVRPGTMPTSAVGAKLVSRAPDMTRLLDKLEERGLIRRERRPENRRVVECGITPQGVELLDRLAAEVRRCHEAQLGHLSQKVLKDLIAMLKEARGPHEAEQDGWPGNE